MHNVAKFASNLHRKNKHILCTRLLSHMHTYRIPRLYHRNKSVSLKSKR